METMFFTKEFDGIVTVIDTIVHVGHRRKLVKSDSMPISIPYQAIWDTGANGTLISPRVVQTLGLVQVGIINARTVGINGVPEVRPIPAFVVNLYLNGLVIMELMVGQGIVANDQIDVLIGMNVICLGDFAISNYNGKTCMSFRYPSTGKIDFSQSPK